MESSGRAFGVLWMLAPILMGLAKIFGWAPFSDMSWLWITFTWWYTLMIGVTAALWTVTADAVRTPDKPKQISKELH